MTRGHPRARGFTLLELMVTLAIAGILVGLVAPSQAPAALESQLSKEAENVASLLAFAQTVAMTERRCVRVVRSTARRLVVERLNALDCDGDPAGLPTADGSASTWTQVSALDVGSPDVAVTWHHIPTETGAGFVAGEPAQLRYRPSGRLFSSDDVLTDDDGVFQLEHARLPAARRTRWVLAEGHGPVCVTAPAVPPSGAAPDFTCF